MSQHNIAENWPGYSGRLYIFKDSSSVFSIIIYSKYI